MLMHNGACMFGTKGMVSNENEKSFCLSGTKIVDTIIKTHQLDKLLELCYAMKRNAPVMVTNH